MINVDEDPAETDNAMDYEGSIVSDASSAAFDDLDSSQSTIVSGNIVQKLNEEVELEPLRGSYVGSTEANDVNPQMEKKGIVSNPVRKQYSTTSSVYAEHTISNPNAEQLLFCIATVLQAQIFDDINSPSEWKTRHPVFDQSPLLPPEFGGHIDILPDDVLFRESQNDEELRKQLSGGAVPAVDTIYRYFNHIKERTRYPTECNIIAFIYTNRMASMGSIALTMQNWRAIWTVSIILAQKMWDDMPSRTSAFVRILPCFTKQLLRDLEFKALSLMQYTSGVKPSLYAKYYFELRSLYSDIRSAAPYTGANEWTQKPLSIIKARRLEDRSINVWEKKAKKSSRAITPILSTPVIESELKTNESSFVGSSSTTCSPRRGWQTTNLFHAQAHARTLFMGMYEDSKEKNFNPYVNDSRPRSGLRSPCVEDLHTDNLSLLSTNRSPATSITQSSVNTSGWVFAGTQRGEELVVRTYEDITLTDTSRFVIS